MEKLFDKLFELAENNGDKFIVYNQTFKKAFVVMDIDYYQKLLKAQGSMHQLKTDEKSKLEADMLLWQATKDRLKNSKKVIEKHEQRLVEPGISNDYKISKSIAFNKLPNQNDKEIVEGEEYYFEDLSQEKEVDSSDYSPSNNRNEDKLGKNKRIT